MSDFSFDIVSRVDRQNLADAVNQAQREIATRFDFKNSRSSIELSDLTARVAAGTTPISAEDFRVLRTLAAQAAAR